VYGSRPDIDTNLLSKGVSFLLAHERLHYQMPLALVAVTIHACFFSPRRVIHSRFP
jgi:hypothetical protein